VSLPSARVEFTGEPARLLLEFVAGSKRGLCADTSAKGAERGEE
jgi:hypothetical protein